MCFNWKYQQVCIKCMASQLVDAEVYLMKHHIMTYIEDAVTFLLERKEDDPKIKPYEVLADYFMSVKQGTHIIYRDYACITSTPHNRASFIKCFWNAYSKTAVQLKSMKVIEYRSLLRLLCYDFPSSMLLKVGKVIFNYDILESLVSFSDFLYTFQTVFYYESFLERCDCACKDIASGQTPLDAINSGSTMVVSMPSAEHNCFNRPESSNSVNSTASSSVRLNTSSDGEVQLDVDLFTKSVLGLCMKFEKEPWECCPSAEVLAEIIGELACVNFYNFALALSRSERINSEIGVLPERSNLLLAVVVQNTSK